MSCDVCGASSAGGQYCTTCGEPLVAPVTASHTAVGTRERTRPAPGAWLALQEIRLLACPGCGAPNSAARWRCARCGLAFDDSVHTAPATGAGPVEPPVAVPPESSRWLVLITVAAGVAVVAVAIMMLSARGIGPFGDGGQIEPALSEAILLRVDRVEASGSTGDDGAARNIADDDTSTAWRVAGDGVGQWIELDFGKPVQIDHLLVWNGDQRSDGAFSTNSRVRGMVIEFPDTNKVYDVNELPSRQQSVRVTMKRRPPVTDSIRIRITRAWPGEDPVTAISEIQALAVPAASNP